MNLTSKMDPKSKKNFRKTQDQKVYAPWIHVQMTSNFESDISKHIKKKYQKTPGKFFLKKIFFNIMYSPRGFENVQVWGHQFSFKDLMNTLIFVFNSVKWWLDRCFHVFTRGSLWIHLLSIQNFFKVLVFYPPLPHRRKG